MKWLRWRFSSKEKDAMQNPRDRELYRGILGLSPSSKKREINVRILYPRSKTTELSVADVLAILITVCLERVKDEEKGKNDRLFINDVRIDRKGRYSTETEIIDDIHNESCFVIIILSNDMLHTPHSTFEKELKHVLTAREEKKSEKMFLLITTCNPDLLKCQNKKTTMGKIFKYITQGETVLSSGLSTTWVKNVIYEKYIKI